MLMRVIVFASLAAVMAPSQAAQPPELSRGITADGRVITSPYGVPPPWGRDITHLEKAHYPESLRAKHPVASGFFRLMFDLRTGRVRKVVVERSSGYPAADANIVTALQQWQLKPNTWKEFQVHVSIGYGSKPQASNKTMQPTAGRRTASLSMTKTRLFQTALGLASGG
jgi:TonB family protein